MFRFSVLWAAILLIGTASPSYALLPQSVEKSVPAGGSVVLFAINAYQADRGCTSLSQGAVDTMPKLKFGTIVSEVVTRVQDGPCGKIPYNIQIVRYQAGANAGTDTFELVYFYSYQSGGQERIKVNVNVLQKGTSPKTPAVDSKPTDQVKTTSPLALVSHVQNLQPKTVFKYEATDLIKGQKLYVDHVVLEKDSRAVKIRNDRGRSQFLHVYDTQLRELNSGNVAYVTGGCTGLPTKLEVGVSENHDASFSIVNSNTKKNSKQTTICNSSVVAASQLLVDGIQYPFFEIKNISKWKLQNGDQVTFGISGKFSPVLGYWLERKIVETRNNTVFREFSYKLMSVKRWDAAAKSAAEPTTGQTKASTEQEDAQSSFSGIYVNNLGNQIQIEKNLLYFTGVWSGQKVSKKPFVTVQNSGGKLIWGLYDCEGDATTFVCTHQKNNEQRVYRRLN